MYTLSYISWHEIHLFAFILHKKRPYSNGNNIGADSSLYAYFSVSARRRFNSIIFYSDFPHLQNTFLHVKSRNRAAISLNKAMKIFSMHQVNAYFLSHNVFRQLMEKPNMVHFFFILRIIWLFNPCIHVCIGTFILIQYQFQSIMARYVCRKFVYEVFIDK